MRDRRLNETRKPPNEYETYPTPAANRNKTNRNKNEHDTEEMAEQDYCQLTSSKVLVEDLVTSEEDERHFQEYHTEENNKDDAERHQTHNTSRRFWDRPIIQDNMGWPGDHRMPEEWNWMMNDIWCYQTRSAKAESIGPVEFTRTRYPNNDYRQMIRDEMSIAPEWGTAESIRMATMIDRNEDRNHRKTEKPVRDRRGKH